MEWWKPSSKSIALNCAVSLYYDWNINYPAKLAFCNIRICDIRTSISTPIYTYAVCEYNLQFVVINWEIEFGMMYDKIYNLCKWVEGYVFTKDSINNIFTRLLHKDINNILKRNVISTYEAALLISHPDQLDNDVVG